MHAEPRPRPGRSDLPQPGSGQAPATGRRLLGEFSPFGPRETEQFGHILIDAGFHWRLYSWAKQHGMGFQSSWLAAMSHLPHTEQR